MNNDWVNIGTATGIGPYGFLHPSTEEAMVGLSCSQQIMGVKISGLVICFVLGVVFIKHCVDCWRAR